MFRVECNKYNCPPTQLKFLYKMLIRTCSLDCKMLSYFLDYLTELPVTVFGFLAYYINVFLFEIISWDYFIFLVIFIVL